MVRATAASARPYHHGDLRRAVVEAALEEIALGGAAALSLRQVARRAGVSHAAPAHHFGDKAGVLTAIAAEGYDLLARATGEALAAGGNLWEVGAAYVRFSAGHQSHFEVMWRPDLCHVNDPDLARARDTAFGVLLDASARALGDDEADALGLAVAAWSFAHGFASLLVHGNLPPELGTDEEVISNRLATGLTNLVACHRGTPT